MSLQYQNNLRIDKIFSHGINSLKSLFIISFYNSACLKIDYGDEQPSKRIIIISPELLILCSLYLSYLI